MKKFYITGEINNHQIKSHTFRTERKAFRYLDSVLNEHNLQVVNNRKMCDNIQEFVCNYHTRFFIGQL